MISEINNIDKIINNKVVWTEWSKAPDSKSAISWVQIP